MGNCLGCQSGLIKKNGHIHTGRQRYKYLDCCRQFALNPLSFPVSPDKISLIEKLLLERLSLAGIARVVGVAESWLQGFVHKKVIFCFFMENQEMRVIDEMPYISSSFKVLPGLLAAFMLPPCG